MIKIKNKILIYFIFYINNISFLKNKQIRNHVATNKMQKKFKDKKKKKIKKKNNQVIIPKNKFKDKKNILIKIIIGFSGMSLLFFLFFVFRDKIDDYRLYKKTGRFEFTRIESMKDYIKNNIDNLDFLIAIDKDNKDYIQIKKKYEFLTYLNRNFFKYGSIFNFYPLDAHINSFEDFNNDVRKKIFRIKFYKNIFLDQSFIKKILSIVQRLPKEKVLSIDTTSNCFYCISFYSREFKKQKQILYDILSKYCE